MPKFLLACKEINGSIYVTRLPQVIHNANGTVQPGVPDDWFFVGPGSTPSVSEYSGNQFILMFSYLSRIIIRILDISTWPPTQVNPISVSGGPNPPSSFLFGITSFAPPNDPGLLNENFIFEVPASFNAAVSVVNQFDPPYLRKNLIFFNPSTNVYTLLLQPDPGWITNIPNTTNFFRLYRSPLGPTPVWTLIEDWNTTFASSGFTDTETGSLQFQYAASIGAFFNPLNPGSTTDHEESLKGPILAFDSTVHPLGFLLTPADVMDLAAGTDNAQRGIPNSSGYGIFTATQRFFVQQFADTLNAAGLRTPVAGQPPTPLDNSQTSGSVSVGAREGFISFPQSTPGLLSDVMKFGQESVPVTGQPSTFLIGANAACSLFG